MRLEGLMVAIVTPMKDGAVDHKSLRELCEWQLAEGTDGIIPCGTTGESATLTARERYEVVKTVVEQVKGRALVIAGAGSNATHEAIDGVKAAKELKADAALVVTPYYNKPTQEGLFRHYQAIWEAARFPVVAYNVPSRTAVDLLPETVARLVKAGAICGIKEATANMDRQVQLVELCGPDGLAYLSGDDFTVLPYIACGGHGVISVVANVAPRAMKALVVACRKGDLATALEAAGGHGGAEPDDVRRDQPRARSRPAWRCWAAPGRSCGCRWRRSRRPAWPGSAPPCSGSA